MALSLTCNILLTLRKYGKLYAYHVVYLKTTLKTFYEVLTFFYVISCLHWIFRW
nr:hypothetical protein [uncultured bacterium]